MRCSECGCFMARTVSCEEHFQYESDGVPVRVITTEMYEQCNREGCGYCEVENVVVEVERNNGSLAEQPRQDDRNGTISCTAQETFLHQRE